VAEFRAPDAATARSSTSTFTSARSTRRRNTPRRSRASSLSTTRCGPTRPSTSCYARAPPTSSLQALPRGSRHAADRTPPHAADVLSPAVDQRMGGQVSRAWNLNASTASVIRRHDPPVRAWGPRFPPLLPRRALA